MGEILVTTPQRFNIENKNHLKRLGLAQEYLARSFLMQRSHLAKSVTG